MNWHLNYVIVLHIITPMCKIHPLVYIIVLGVCCFPAMCQEIPPSFPYLLAPRVAYFTAVYFSHSFTYWHLDYLIVLLSILFTPLHIGTQSTLFYCLFIHSFTYWHLKYVIILLSILFIPLPIGS